MNQERRKIELATEAVSGSYGMLGIFVGMAIIVFVIGNFLTLLFYCPNTKVQSLAISLQEFIMLSFLGLNRTIKRISFAFRFQNLCTSSAESFSIGASENRQVS